MFSKDPSELVRKEKMDNEEIARSIRLSLAAELDAINFYLQQSRLMPEGSFRKVHQDISGEEVAHFGEFLRLLYEYSPEEFSKINEGWEEASGLLGKNPDTDNFIKMEKKEGERKMESEMNEFMPNLFGFSTRKWEQDGIPLPEDQQNIIPINRMTYGFTLSKDTIKPYRDQEMLKNAKAFRRKLLKFLLFDQKSSIGQRSESLKPGNWDQPGKILEDVIKAISKLYESGYSDGIVVILSPSVYSKALRESDNTGQTELDLIREVAGDVEVCHQLEGNQLFIVHRKSFWILVREEPSLRKISETAESENYVIKCRISSLLYDHNASINMKFAKA